MHWYRRLTWTVVAAGLAFFPGCIGGLFLAREIGSPDAVGKTVPLPHHIPKSPDAVAFRFAMAHDVIHERYPKHGPAFYTERNRLARERLTAIPPDSDETFALTDDIGAGLDRLGKPAEAVPLLRRKLELQEKRGLSGKQLYTTYANLGTFIVHAHMKAAMGGDATAKDTVQQGLELVKESIAVNPNAHFGRETWQLAIGRFLVAAIDQTELLITTDCIGNRLSRKFPPEAFRPAVFFHDGNWARPYQPRLLKGGDDYLAKSRDSISHVGGEPDTGEPDPDRKEVAPFDEPVLGIIGMWRQGGGANPHFALCLGEVMLRVGQRRIAWAAFERASRMADRYWPDAAKPQFLRDHCAKRQKFIEGTLPAGEVAEMRPQFEAELAFGENYQREYQEYEAAKIAAGADIRDEHLFDEFHRGREPIATEPGPEEYLVTKLRDWTWEWEGRFMTASGVFASGLTALLMAWWLRTRAARSVSPKG